LVALVAGGIACADAPATQSTALRLDDFRGAYTYRAFHEEGRLLLTGTFTFDRPDDSTIGGSWSIAWAPGADTTAVVGPQVGTGQLAGALEDDHVRIGLNPGWADNNVDLAAEQRTADRVAGRWSHSTIIGPVAQGRFELQR
jgi:hypothetical protein